MAVAEAVAATIEKVKAANPNINLKLIVTSVTRTLENYHSALESLYEGAALAVIVVLLFLRDLRTTIVAAITLPLSILPCPCSKMYLALALGDGCGITCPAECLSVRQRRSALCP